MSYPVADVDRFAEYESNPLPVRVRGAELTVGAISSEMRAFAQAFDLLRGELSTKRGASGAAEYDLWCWLGAQLLELKKNPEKSRIVLAYWRSLYPKTPGPKISAVPRDALDARTALLDPELYAAPEPSPRKLAFEVIYDKPMLSVAMFALEHVRRNEKSPELLGAVPRDLYLKLAMQARPRANRDPALAVRIVAHLIVEELELTRAVERDLADLVRPAARKKLGDRDAARFAKLIDRLPAAWGLGAGSLEVVRAFQEAADRAAWAMASAIELLERIGRAVSPRLGQNEWPLSSTSSEPRASADELHALIAWIRGQRATTQTLARLHGACVNEVKR